MPLNALTSNRQYATLLGWTPSDFGAASFDASLIELVRAVQTKFGFAVKDCDGICGPFTYRTWLAAQSAHLEARRPQSPDWLADAGTRALYEAKLVWLNNVIDPPNASAEYAPSRGSIESMIRTNKGIEWSWTQPYMKNGDFEWCGAFAAFAWRACGMKRDWRRSFFSSTYRLDLWGRYLAFEAAKNDKPATGPFRQWLELDENSGPLDAFFSDDDPPRAGDILLVGGMRTGPGKHVTLVESYDAENGMFTTIEGNGTGAAPNGRSQHGVIRAKRPVGLPRGAGATTYHARRLIRPAIVDLLP